jgi:hypothetical protein
VVNDAEALAGLDLSAGEAIAEVPLCLFVASAARVSGVVRP